VETKWLNVIQIHFINGRHSYAQMTYASIGKTPICFYIFLIGIVGSGVQLGPLGTAATIRPFVPATGDYDDGEIGGMMIGRGNRSTRIKPAPVPLCPPQTPLAARTRTRAVAVGSQRLTASATARPQEDR
jgi:hypothetical protein